MSRKRYPFMIVAGIKQSFVMMTFLCGIIPMLTCPCSGAAAASERQWVSTPLGELDPVSADQGWGELRVNESVWGKPLQIGGRKFTRGLGTHAPSELVYDLNKAYERFEAWVGVDAAMMKYKGASIIFKVLADGRELFNSGVMGAEAPAKRVSVSLAGAATLTLVVEDAGDGDKYDHADWAEAVLLGKSGPAGQAPSVPPAKFRVDAPGLSIELSAEGGIVGAMIGSRKLARPIQGGTRLVQCAGVGVVASRKLEGGGVEFTRTLAHVTGQRATLVERFLPARDSVRWEIEIQGQGEPWSTGIETRLTWPTEGTPRYWTAWDDPEHKRDQWRDPLLARPLDNAQMWYGAPHWSENKPGDHHYQSGINGGFSIPIVTVMEPERNLGLSLALSPEDTPLEMSLTTHKDGRIAFTRRDHRLARTRPVRFAMDLIAHEADWRCGLDWMTRRYAEYFNPPNPLADEIGGLGAYSDWEGELDTARLKKIGFTLNWKASYDFPYMGMFLPPIADSEPYTRFIKKNQTSIRQLRDYSRRMRQMGFYVLNYFNVTEFGGTRDMPAAADPALAPGDAWKNVNNYLYGQIADGILRDPKGEVFKSWGGCIAMDCAGPNYRAHLLEQARRHVAKLPDSSGICIDRMDWLRHYNSHADDGLSWRQGQPSRSLRVSWRELMSELGPIFHEANKVIFVNPITNRLDLMRQVDGVYNEIGDIGAELNASAFQCVRKPCLAWTHKEDNLKPDPDAYFQRHLYLGAFPTAPLPVNDHTVHPSAWADKWYLDYGPLFTLLRGKKWVLIPHCIEVEGGAAKANLFEVRGGWVAPVTFGSGRAQVTLKLAGVPGMAGRVHCEALHPGEDQPQMLKPEFDHGTLTLRVPLKQGCAMVKIARE